MDLLGDEAMVGGLDGGTGRSGLRAAREECEKDEIAHGNRGVVGKKGEEPLSVDRNLEFLSKG